ncbi:MAG: hypothetical protein O6952_03820 [Planctomycetota bacterium]|nr:hypothetical protein [Planctomycetota bacterium]
MSATIRKWIKITLIAGLAFEGFYLVSANIYLNTDLYLKTINRKPEKFAIEWDRAITVWPGAVRLYGVRTQGQSKKLQWSASLDKIDAWCRVVPLFWRNVDLLYVRAEGLDYRQRRRLDIFPEWEAGAPAMPPIEGFTNPPDPPPEALYPKKPPKPPWRIIGRHIDVQQIRQIWIDQYRFAGEFRVVTSMDLRVRGPLEFPEIVFETESADVLVEDQVVFGDMNVDVDITIDPFVPRETKGPAFFEYLSGEIAVDMDTSHVDFLRPYFYKSDWVSMNSHGRFKAQLGLEHGVLTPGSRMEIDAKKIDISFLDRELTGTGSIDGEVFLEDGALVSRMTVSIEEFEVAETGAAEPYILGEGFKLEMIGRGADLANPFSNVNLTLDLPRSDIPDFRFYNRYVPPTSGFVITSGAGRISYHFAGSHEEGSLHGNIEILAEHLGTQLGDLEIIGDLAIRTRLQEGMPMQRLFDISGTRIEMDNVSVIKHKKGESKHLEDAWHGRFVLSEARMRFSQPAEIDAQIDVEMKNTEPLVALFDAKKGVPKFIERLMTIKNVHAHADLVSKKEGVEITDLEVTGKGLKFLGDLRLGNHTKDGILYVRFRGLSLGILLEAGKKDLKFIRPLHWFQEQRKLSRGEAAAGAGS